MEFCYVLEKYGSDYVLPVNSETQKRIEFLRNSPDVSFCYEADVIVSAHEVTDKSYLDVVIEKFGILLSKRVEINVGSTLTKEWLAAQIMTVQADFVDRLLTATHGNIKKAGSISGYNRKSIYRIATDCGIDVNDYR